MLGSLDVVIVVLIISAGMLAFVVLYNLNNININERKRELATLKVLGFFDGEVSSYVFRENVLLTVFGCILGVVLGSALHRYVITTVEIESYMFGRIIKLPSYLISIATHLLLFHSGQSSDAFQAEKDRHGGITEECGIRIGDCG